MTDHPLRLPERALSDDEARGILDEAAYCVVSTADEDGAPYGVPLSFVHVDGRLYVHTAREGHKIADFARDARVCATAVVDVEACFEDGFMTTRYASAIARGRIRRVEDDREVRHALVALCMKYLPAYKKEIGPAIDRDIDEVAVWAIEIESLSGKANRRRKQRA